MSQGRIWSSTVVLLLAWGVFALGSTRSWGYMPLLAGLTTYGIAALIKHKQSRLTGNGLSVSVAAFWAAIVLQLVPLPTAVVGLISPVVLLVGAQGFDVLRPMSVDPGATGLGLAFVTALGLFFVGAVRTMKDAGVHRLCLGLIAIGTIVALVGIAESTGRLAGIYEIMQLTLPRDSTPLGPFPSKNHYAGWMLMTIAIPMGYLCSLLGKAEGPRPAHVFVVQSAVTTMAIALVQTRSRAGILGLMLSVVIMAAILVRRAATRTRGLLVATPLILVLVTGVVISWGEPIVRRFVTDSWSTAHGRLPIWHQAVAIARDFPLAGSGFNTYQTIVHFYPTLDRKRPVRRCPQRLSAARRRGWAASQSSGWRDRRVLHLGNTFAFP